MGRLEGEAGSPRARRFCTTNLVDCKVSIGISELRFVFHIRFQLDSTIRIIARDSE
jgi:hypothetical protein